MKKLVLLGSLVIFFFSIGMNIGLAGGNGSSPNGKPFIAINDQIVEVQGAVTTLGVQVEELIGKVESIEGRLDAAEAAIADVEAQNETLAAQIAAYGTDNGAMEARIAELEADNISMQAMIDNNEGDIADLETRISDNEALIQSLLLDIAGLGSLTDQVAHNEDLILALQNEMVAVNEALALKQAIVNGTCQNANEHLVQINPDGSVVCDSDSVVIASMTTYNRTAYITVYPNSYRNIGLGCYSNDAALNGAVDYCYNPVYGYSTGPDYDSQGWLFSLYNNHSYNYSYCRVRVTCAGVVNTTY